jgi:hypothetical protein
MDTTRNENQRVRERRFRPRRRVGALAFFRERGRSRWQAQVTDLSSLGCRLEMSTPVVDGELSWVTLPGLEPWSCSVVWRADDQIGLAFNRPLHQAVAASMCERISLGGWHS